ncbi:putative nucleotidyltransferase [Pedobacter sp. UYEF25]
MKIKDQHIEIREYAISTSKQRMDALFYMQTHWINNNGKLMDIADDFYLEFIKLLNNNKVEYLLVGGFAVNYHGYPRTTHDLDLWANNNPKNSVKLLTAIDEFGFNVDVLKGVYLKGNEPIKLPHDSISFKKIEILADISGMYDFAIAYENKIITSYDGVEIPFIGFDDLIKNKLSSGRAKDLDDISILRKIVEERKENKPVNSDSNTLKRKVPKS